MAFVSWPRALYVLDRASCPLCLGWGFVPSCLGWGLGASFWASAALVSWMGLRAFYEAFAAVVSWMGLDFLFLAAVPLCLVSKLTFSWKLPSVPRDYSWHDSHLDGECGWQVYGQGVFDLAECSEKNPRGAEFVTGEWDFSLKRQKQMHGYFAGRSQRRQCVAIFAGHKGHRKVSCLEG